MVTRLRRYTFLPAGWRKAQCVYCAALTRKATIRNHAVWHWLQDNRHDDGAPVSPTTLEKIGTWNTVTVAPDGTASEGGWVSNVPEPR